MQRPSPSSCFFFMFSDVTLLKGSEMFFQYKKENLFPHKEALRTFFYEKKISISFIEGIVQFEFLHSIIPFSLLVGLMWGNFFKWFKVSFLKWVFFGSRTFTQPHDDIKNSSHSLSNPSFFIRNLRHDFLIWSLTSWKFCFILFPSKCFYTNS